MLALVDVVLVSGGWVGPGSYLPLVSGDRRSQGILGRLDCRVVGGCPPSARGVLMAGRALLIRPLRWVAPRSGNGLAAVAGLGRELALASPAAPLGGCQSRGQPNVAIIHIVEGGLPPPRCYAA